MGNLYLKGIDPKRSQSRGIDEIASLGQELAQLEKPPNRVRFKRDLGQSHQPKRHKILRRDTHQKLQEIILKTPRTKSSKNHH
jgi:ribosomal protein L29